jgi:hypothetical protein
MDICWIKGTKNEADIFTKNLDGPAFLKCIMTLVGQDVYMKGLTPTSEQGRCQEVSYAVPYGTQESIKNLNK